MVSRMKEYLGSDRFIEFKKFSSDFRNEKITVEQYYVRYQALFGEMADELFPILVELLPDPSKRDRLEKVHLRAQEVLKPQQGHTQNEGQLTKNYTERTCPYCSKKVSPRNWKEHVDKHRLEEKKPTGIEDYPALPSEASAFVPLNPTWRNPNTTASLDFGDEFPSLPQNSTPPQSEKKPVEPLNYSQLSHAPIPKGKKKKNQKITLMRFG